MTYDFIQYIIQFLFQS